MARATATNNLKVILDAFVKTHEERLKKERQQKSKVKSKPDSNPGKRGAQGPRNPPYNNQPSQRINGLQGSRSTAKPSNTPPRSATPRASRVGEQIRQAKKVQKANPGRAARRPNVPARAAAVAGGVYVGGQILRSSGKPGAAKMSRLGIGGNAPVSNKKTKTSTKPTAKPTAKRRVERKPIQAPPKKGSTVLAKKGGKEGVMRNGAFYATGWSTAQRNRYQIERLKQTKKANE